MDPLGCVPVVRASHTWIRVAKSLPEFMMNQLTQLIQLKKPPVIDGPESEKPHDVLRWASREYGSSLVLTTSLGPQTLVILDMLHKLSCLSDVHVFFLDTGLLFAETYALRRRVQEHYGIAIDAVRPRLDLYDQERAHGKELWQHDPDLCCRLRKVEPMQRALSGVSAYITGLRRDQSITRGRVGVVEWDARWQLAKINPLASWTRERVSTYLHEHGVPYNPLLDDGYPSVGCVPCTARASATAAFDERAGRWAGMEKTECGLHRPLAIADED
jgi:phosphoadenosine phosphosulfate reductase